MKKALCVLLVLAGVAMVGLAQTGAIHQAKPDFTGTWKLNVAKSDFGEAPQPVSETDVLTQTGDMLKVSIASESERGKRNYVYSVKLDGTDTPFPSDAFPAGSPFKILSSKAEWQGASLVITQTTTFQDAKGTLKATYTLSADGKVLTKATHISMEMGDFDTKSVFDKE